MDGLDNKDPVDQLKVAEVKQLENQEADFFIRIERRETPYTCALECIEDLLF